MTGYHVVEPEVAGGWGPDTQFTRTPGQPVVVHKLHYVFDGWLGDQLLETSPCYIVTAALADRITQANLTGFVLDSVKISKSDQFESLYPGRELPDFRRFRVEGAAGQDDFGVTRDLMLVVSDTALATLQDVGITHALVEPYDGAA